MGSKVSIKVTRSDRSDLQARDHLHWNRSDWPFRFIFRHLLKVPEVPDLTWNQVRLTSIKRKETDRECRYEGFNNRFGGRNRSDRSWEHIV
jgi:hypothetical protein